MKAAYHRLLLIFADGVGLAAASEGNPFAVAPSPALRGLLGGPLTLESRTSRERLLLTGLDACLGVDGLPQSATGQTALFSGVNAPRLLGRHVTGFVGPRLEAVLESGNLFLEASRRGHSVTFANAYRPPGRRRTASVTTRSLEIAGLPRRSLEELVAGRAVAWDIVRDRFGAALDGALPTVTPRQAGRHLGAIASRHELTVYETFLTDLAGHRRDGLEPAEAVRRLDGLIGGVLAGAGPELTVLLTSDHGNLEDAATRSHTRNPVPLLAVGPAASRFRGATSILDVTPRILASFVPS
jgi:2,3-bisphosphoglycerate-independent phosphoglycerate mutase